MEGDPIVNLPKVKFYQRHNLNNGPAAMLSKEFLW